MSTLKGRQGAPVEEAFDDTIARKSAPQGMLIKIDEFVDAMKALAAKLDSDGGITDTDYASTITDALAKLELK